MKVTKTYSLNAELAQKFDEETPSRKTSQELENAMRQYLGEQDHSENSYLFDSIELTDNQDQLLDMILQKDLPKLAESNDDMMKMSDVVKSAKSRGIYANTGSAKNAVKSFGSNENIPFIRQGSKLAPMKVSCECGSVCLVTVLVKNGGECPKCCDQIIDPGRLTGNLKSGDYDYQKPGFL